MGVQSVIPDTSPGRRREAHISSLFGREERSEGWAFVGGEKAAKQQRSLVTVIPLRHPAFFSGQAKIELPDNPLAELNVTTGENE